MAPQAGDSHVLSGQREFGLSVIKPGGWLPSSLGMTACAISSKVSAMLVAMTGDAIGRQPEIRSAGIQSLILSECKSRDKRGLVAFPTIQTGMLFLKNETSERMVEGFLAVFPVDQVEISTLVFDMAILTVLVLRSAMETFPGFTLILDPSVASKAIIRNQFMISAVTLGAVLHSFERSMHAMEVAR